MSLRPFIKDDLAMVLVWRNALEVRQSMYSQHEITELEHFNWFLRLEKDEQSFWYVYEDAEGTPRGVVYFSDYNSKNRSSFWGFYTAPESPAGTGSSMAFDALHKAFNELNLHKLNAEVLMTNMKSIKFHKKLFFVEEGVFRDYYLVAGEYVNVIRFGMLHSEWSSLHVTEFIE
jgi:UDP-4-amino-4,6-dideoxy-N-acetyl-beta-L-altrosamine N-acetyltransferase